MLDSRITARDYYFLWQKMEFNIVKYLTACSSEHLNGAAKTENHIVLVQTYVGAALLKPPGSVLIIDPEFEIVHDATQELTDQMDVVIEFPLEGQPDYATLAPRFFHKFLEFASAALPFEEAQCDPSDAYFLDLLMSGDLTFRYC